MTVWIIRLVGGTALCIILLLGIGLYKQREDVYLDITWHDLIDQNKPQPDNYFSHMNLSELDDVDPMAQELLAELLVEWANAPVNELLDQRLLSISGYVVPLEWTKDHQLKEFLLVPYFGACIHSPPPPANQIIYINLIDGIKNIHSMDYVSVSGRLMLEKNDSATLGISSYTILPKEIKRL